MRLDFNILWVEDQPAAVSSQKEKLERLIGNEGFRLRTEFSGSVEDATSKLRNDIFTDNVDLILMDYDLGQVKGDTGLIAVRRTLPYKEIVFYSSQANNLKGLVAKTGVEGVYCADRQDLPEKAHGVFETLVKKVLDIDHARGIVMGATSDIDHVVNDCLQIAFSNGGQENQSEMLLAIKERMKEIRTNFEKNASAIESSNHLNGVFDGHAVYSSVDRLNLLRNHLKERALHKDLHDPMAEYIYKTIPKRNVLAHVRGQKGPGFSRQLVDKGGKSYTSDEIKSLRLELVFFHDLMEDLSARMKKQNHED